MIGDRLPDVTESVREGLQVMAVGSDGEVSLDYAAEFHLVVDGTSHLIIEEEVADEGV